MATRKAKKKASFPKVDHLEQAIKTGVSLAYEVACVNDNLVTLKTTDDALGYTREGTSDGIAQISALALQLDSMLPNLLHQLNNRKKKK